MLEIIERIPQALRYLIYGTIPKRKIPEMSREEWIRRHQPDPVLEALEKSSREFFKRYHNERRAKAESARSWKSILDSDD